MSGVPENRWRRQTERPNNATAQPLRQRRESGQAQPNQAAAALPPQTNAWTSGDRSRSGSGPRGGNGPRAVTPSNANQNTNTLPGDSHVSLNGFNSTETKDFLKQSYQNAVIGDTGKKALWKAQGEATNAKPSGPWGAKPTVMANGQDFWVQLTKQVAAKEAGG